MVHSPSGGGPIHQPLLGKASSKNGIRGVSTPSLAIYRRVSGSGILSWACGQDGSAQPWPLVERGLLARGPGSRPKAPTMPPFFLLGRAIVPGWKKEDMLNCHIMGNSRQSMLLNFNVNFLIENALDAIRSLELILKLEAAIKG